MEAKEILFVEHFGLPSLYTDALFPKKMRGGERLYTGYDGRESRSCWGFRLRINRA